MVIARIIKKIKKSVNGLVVELRAELWRQEKEILGLTLGRNEVGSGNLPPEVKDFMAGQASDLGPDDVPPEVRDFMAGQPSNAERNHTSPEGNDFRSGRPANLTRPSKSDDSLEAFEKK
jgi:hypothetical protein